MFCKAFFFKRDELLFSPRFLRYERLSSPVRRTDTIDYAVIIITANDMHMLLWSCARRLSELFILLLMRRDCFSRYYINDSWRTTETKKKKTKKKKGENAFCVFLCFEFLRCTFVKHREHDARSNRSVIFNADRKSHEEAENKRERERKRTKTIRSWWCVTVSASSH